MIKSVIKSINGSALTGNLLTLLFSAASSSPLRKGPTFGSVTLVPTGRLDGPEGKERGAPAPAPFAPLIVLANLLLLLVTVSALTLTFVIFLLASQLSLFLKSSFIKSFDSSACFNDNMTLCKIHQRFRDTTFPISFARFYSTPGKYFSST